MARVTMSSVARLRDCAWWARPEATWVWTPSGPAAEFGTAVHEVVASGVAGYAAKSSDPAVMATAQSVLDWFDSERPTHATWHAEPAYVLDLGTASARHVGNNIGRRYPKVTDLELAGSADIVGVSDGRATCLDLKTGRRENVDPADENAQLATLALAVHLAHGVDTVRVGLVFPGLGGVATDEHTLDAIDLAAWHAELTALVESIPTSRPTPTKKACQYCPAKAACPAMVDALAVVTPKRLPLAMAASAITSPDQARAQYETLRAIKGGVDAAWGALRQYIDENGPIDLGDGRAYGPRTSSRESIDLSTRAAVDVLRAELGPAWEAAVTLDTSKTAIKDASREVAKATGEKITAVERRTLDALRAVGAVKQTTSTTWDELTTKDKVA